MFYDLDNKTPVKVFCNRHFDPGDNWFDMHYQVEVGIVLSGKMNRKYINYEIELLPGDVWINEK